MNKGMDGTLIVFFRHKGRYNFIMGRCFLLCCCTSTKTSTGYSLICLSDLLQWRGFLSHPM